MAIRRLPSPYFRVVDVVDLAQDENGNGWKLHTYIPGTTDDKAAYQDKDGATPHANPIILTNGQAEIWWNGVYDLKLTDENDTQKWTNSNHGDGDETVNYGNFNKVKDGGFEDDSDGDALPDQWTTTVYPTAGSGAGVAVLDTSDQIEGAQSLKFTSVGDGGGYTLSSFFEVTEGALVAAAWQTKSSVAGVRNLVEIVWYTAAQVLISASSIFDDSTTNPTAWTQKTGSATAPSTARFAKLRMYGCHSSDATSGSTWFDDVKVITDSVVGDLTVINDLTLGNDLIVGATTLIAADLVRLDVTTEGTSEASKVLTAAASGKVTLAAATAAGTLKVTGAASQWATEVRGDPVTGTSQGLWCPAGTNSSDLCAEFDSQSGSTPFFRIQGNGGVRAGSPAGGVPALGVINAEGYEQDGVALYEEGTFTPTLQDGSFSDAESQTYTTQLGNYTKIGNRVFIDGHMEVNSLGSLDTGGTAYIGGLPYTAKTETNYSGSIHIGNANSLALVTAGWSLAGLVQSNTDRIFLTSWDATTGTTTVAISNISAGGKLEFSGSYLVA